MDDARPAETLMWLIPSLVPNPTSKAGPITGFCRFLSQPEGDMPVSFNTHPSHFPPGKLGVSIHSLLATAFG